MRKYWMMTAGLSLAYMLTMSAAAKEPQPGDDRSGGREPQPGDDRGGHGRPFTVVVG